MRAWAREVEGDAVVGLAQEGLAGGLGREHARLAFDAELALETAVARNQANDGLGEVDVEIVADDVPAGIGATPLSKLRRNRAKSFSVRVLPIMPSTLPVATLKAAIRV